ncbi:MULTISPECIES: hypothetical protein [unclassified Streptomyces]|uniref:hypothetical protein n=1 Tax=unclassified Streptomyces TaxID=2593676 RepID=UPI0004C86581|nr:MULTISPECIES: hypothetical protein [unclassified Streptomyces]
MRGVVALEATAAAMIATAAVTGSPLGGTGRFMTMLTRFWVLGADLAPLLDSFFGGSGPSHRTGIEPGAAARAASPT